MDEKSRIGRSPGYARRQYRALLVPDFVMLIVAVSD
jgi:hypothetical protein